MQRISMVTLLKKVKQLRQTDKCQKFDSVRQLDLLPCFPFGVLWLAGGLCCFRHLYAYPEQVPHSHWDRQSRTSLTDNSLSNTVHFSQKYHAPSRWMHNGENERVIRNERYRRNGWKRFESKTGHRSCCRCLRSMLVNLKKLRK